MFDSQVLAFTVVAAIMTMTPGADTLLVVRNVLRGGRREGFVTMFGICSGLYAHALLSALGVSVILMHSATAFTVLKVAGACYLVWLGCQSLRSAVRPAAPQADPGTIASRAPALRSFREGFLTNLLNPKVVVFYLALLPQFMGPGDAVLQKSLLLASIHFTQGILWFSMVSILVDRSRQFFMRPRQRRLIDAACGTILVALGFRLAWQQR
ncbi:MAG: LysE family translocator [Steroidobacteraceae bacterium]